MARRLVIGATLLALAGCSGTGSLFRGGASRSEAGESPPTPQVSPSGDSSGLVEYLDMMQRLIEGDALTRAATFNDARDAADFAPTTTNRLRYALALSVPGHNGSDAEAAAARLRDLVAATDALLPEERSLARLQLRQAEQLVILEAQSVELRAQLATSLATRDAENADRIRSLQAENQRLAAELKDATQMLDAITSIEQSISEREDQ
jgi:hypothetical protein